MNRLKTALIAVGFPLAAAGVLLNDRRVVWAAIVALTIALGLRLYLRRRPPLQ